MFLWLWFFLVEESWIFREVKELRDVVLDIKYYEYKKKFEESVNKKDIKI